MVTPTLLFVTVLASGTQFIAQTSDQAQIIFLAVAAGGEAEGRGAQTATGSSIVMFQEGTESYPESVPALEQTQPQM